LHPGLIYRGHPGPLGEDSEGQGAGVPVGIDLGGIGKVLVLVRHVRGPDPGLPGSEQYTPIRPLEGHRYWALGGDKGNGGSQHEDGDWGVHGDGG
jgi:hypothetical protein